MMSFTYTSIHFPHPREDRVLHHHSPDIHTSIHFPHPREDVKKSVLSGDPLLLQSTSLIRGKTLNQDIRCVPLRTSIHFPHPREDLVCLCGMSTI